MVQKLRDFSKTFFTRPSANSCERCENLLSLYMDDALPERDAAFTRSHLSECAACRRALLVMQAAGEALRARPQSEPPSNLRRRVLAAIAELEAPAAVKAPQRRPALRPAYGYAFALALFAVAGGSMVWNSDHLSSPTVATAPHSIAIPQPSPPAPPLSERLPAHALPPSVSPPLVAPPRTTPIIVSPPTVMAAKPRIFHAARRVEQYIQPAPQLEAARPAAHRQLHAVTATHSAAPTIASSPSLVASRPAAHRPLSVAHLHPRLAPTPSNPETIASLPSPPVSAPSPEAVHVGAPDVTQDQPALVASMSHTVNQGLQRLVLGLNQDKTATVRSIALTSRNVTVRVENESSDSSGTLAITAGPVH